MNTTKETICAVEKVKNKIKLSALTTTAVTWLSIELKVTVQQKASSATFYFL